MKTNLGFTLFTRTTRRIDLSESGQSFHDKAVLLVRDLNEARQMAQDIAAKPSGLLRVTTSVAFGQRWLLPRVGAFRLKFPEITLDLILTDQVVDPISEGIDLAVRHAAVLEDTLIATKLRDTRYRLVASRDYKKGRS